MTKDEALKMAIEALLYGTDHTNAVKACKEALEPTVAELNDEYLRDTHVKGLNKPAQEQVLYIDGGGLDGHATWAQAIRCQDTDIALYTHPKQWHGLSNDEIDNIVVKSETLLAKDIARAIEAKLKEKNTW